MSMKRAATGVFFLFLCGLALAVDPVEIRMRSVWEGMGPGQQRFPFLVTVKNNTGRDAVGELHASGESDSVTIPLEIARGSTKEVPVYLSPGMPTTTVVFDSNLGSYKVESAAMAEFGNFRVGTIGDTSGLLGFLKTRIGPNGVVMSDPQLSVGHCRPEEAPDRVAGYFPLDAVFLSEGAERLSERQIEAIKQYVLQGGRVVIPGGANAPALSSQAWRNALPISEAAPKTFASGVQLVDNAGVIYSIPRAVTLMVGSPTTGSLVAQRTKGVAAAVVRPIGLGSVIFLAYNPFEEPLESQSNRRQIVMSALKSAMYGIPFTRLHAVTMQTADQYEYDPYGGYAPPPPTASSSGITISQEQSNVAANGIYATSATFPSTSLANSPFNAKLIPSDKIGWVFLGFFLVVVPLNFLFLRIIRRMEWTWVTAPIFSIVFAGVLLSFAGNL